MCKGPAGGWGAGEWWLRTWRPAWVVLHWVYDGRCAGAGAGTRTCTQQRCPPVSRTPIHPTPSVQPPYRPAPQPLHSPLPCFSSSTSSVVVRLTPAILLPPPPCSSGSGRRTALLHCSAPVPSPLLLPTPFSPLLPPTPRPARTPLTPPPAAPAWRPPPTAAPSWGHHRPPPHRPPPPPPSRRRPWRASEGRQGPGSRVGLGATRLQEGG